MIRHSVPVALAAVLCAWLTVAAAAQEVRKELPPAPPPADVLERQAQAVRAAEEMQRRIQEAIEARVREKRGAGREGAAPAGAAVTIEVLTLPRAAPAAGPVDRAREAMMREAQANAREREAMFATLNGMGQDVVAPAPPPPAAAPAPARGGAAIIVRERFAVGLAPVPVAAAPAPAVVVNAGVVADRTQMFTRQFRAILKSEYQFLLAVCEPTKDQRREIARAGESALKAAASQYADWQMNRRVVNGKLPPNPDPSKVIREGLDAAAAAHLSAEQVARYRDEVAKRMDDQKRACVLNLVAKLDQVLYLTEDQRARLIELLTERWETSWAPSLQSLLNTGDYVPMVPDYVITPVLNDSQRRVWSGVQKVQFGGLNGWVNGMMIDDTPLEDAELGPEAKAGANGPREEERLLPAARVR
jgi:hypothetical protein